MLAEYLRDTMIAEGADGDAVAERIINMLNNPTDFAEEFAEVQSREAPPVIDGDGVSQPMPAMEEAPPENTMPMPGMAPPPGSTTAKVAADNIAGKCPHCDSHTTGVITEDGKSHCHNCNKSFQTPKVEADPIDSSAMSVHGAAVEPELNDHEDLHVRDVDSPSSMRWVDTDGRPIEVGKEYKMNSNRSDIPDYIKILGPGVMDPDTGQMSGSIIGDVLKYEISGEYGLNHIADISIDELDSEEISFEPAEDTAGGDFDDPVSDPDGGEGTNSDRTMYEGAPEQTDLSKPTVNMASVWGRHARTDEFARPADQERPDIDPADASYPLVDAPYPNKFSSKEALQDATEEWRREYLAPALNQRAAKSLTKEIQRKIAAGEEVEDKDWNRIEELGGPREIEEVEGPFAEEAKVSPDEDWTTWHPPTAEDADIIRGADNVPVGRGLIMQREGSNPILHTWPVSMSERLNGTPELFHGEHMKDIGWDSEAEGTRTAAFDIVTDGDGFKIESNPVWPIDDADMEKITSAHPELAPRGPVFSKAAGAEFNLMEQKEFIGEQGVARNADKLDLENTHYADAAMEEHFLFGL